MTQALHLSLKEALWRILDQCRGVVHWRTFSGEQSRNFFTRYNWVIENRAPVCLVDVTVVCSMCALARTMLASLFVPCLLLLL